MTQQPDSESPSNAGEEPSETSAAPADPHAGEVSQGAAGPDDGARVHRVIKRTTRRRLETEHVEEEITEVLPPRAYAAPPSDHPAPVG